VAASIGVLLLVACLAISPGMRAQAGDATHAPNFLVITVDDQATNSFKRSFMPRTFDWIVDPGTRFRNGLAAPPLCCPDRAGVLTGQYPHNSGVWDNRPGYRELIDPGNTLPVWLHNAGYRTGLIGKYLNHYESHAGLTPAPGFDRWFAFADSDYYYNYEVSNDGVPRSFGADRTDYSTDVLSRKARAFLADPSDAPFFLWLTYNAPHSADNIDLEPCGRGSPTAPDRPAYDRFQHEPLPKPTSFNERNVGDKPLAISKLPALDTGQIASIRRRWRCTLAAMYQVDRRIGRLMQQLKDQGELADTIVVYGSDNGFLFGEHRIARGKAQVYEPSLRVPFALRVPHRYRAEPRVERVGDVVSNQDLAPTMLDYADDYLPDVSPCSAPGHCRRMDGRSLRPLLGDGGQWPVDRAVLAEINDANTSTYEAIRARRFVYEELGSGEKELYDLGLDPGELRNRADSPDYAAEQLGLGLRLQSLEQCSGVEGRDPPTAAPFCE
jgi:N-acetylglucosamine-6-sulfatase